MAGRGSRIFALVAGAVYEGVNELDYLSNVRWLLSNCPMGFREHRLRQRERPRTGDSAAVAQRNRNRAVHTRIDRKRQVERAQAARRRVRAEPLIK